MWTNICFGLNMRNDISNIFPKIRKLDSFTDNDNTRGYFFLPVMTHFYTNFENETAASY